MPWGLRQENSETIESIGNPDFAPQAQREQDPPGPERISDRPLAKDQIREAASETLPNSQTLTHVNTSGEARMVDVGTKPATKRTAIACAYVGFTNSEPFRLIVENANKKGDVLGVARVAGIMGAKRTSELIPLCHPIPITKVDVDVALIPPNSPHPLVLKGSDKNGAVAIEALVECTGPTGVEMEALTAANVAAMTVYDMCKAVDHLIRIHSVQVVYKSGGKSGLHVFRNWAGHRGPKWFAERGLEYPDFKEKQSPTTKITRSGTSGSSKTP
jgi:cyclic pyranopterin phosphate synthase